MNESKKLIVVRAVVITAILLIIGLFIFLISVHSIN